MKLQCIVYNEETNKELEFHDCDKNIHIINEIRVEGYESKDCPAHRQKIREINGQGIEE